jgi:hypothetical protein
VLRGPPCLDGVELAALLDMVRVRCDHGVGHTQTVFGNDSSHFEAIEVLLLHLILRSKASPSAALAMFQSPQQDAVSSPKDCISGLTSSVAPFRFAHDSSKCCAELLTSGKYDFATL